MAPRRKCRGRFDCWFSDDEEIRLDSACAHGEALPRRSIELRQTVLAIARRFSLDDFEREWLLTSISWRKGQRAIWLLASPVVVCERQYCSALVSRNHEEQFRTMLPRAA